MAIDKIILHIGTEKTGTTSIQNHFSRHRQELAAQGYLYPSFNNLPNHVGITITSQNFNPKSELYAAVGIKPVWEEIEIYSDKFWKSFSAQMNNGIYHTVLLSNEHAHSRLRKPEEIERLINKLRQYSRVIEIVCYFRRQVDLAVSLFSTVVNLGGYREKILPTIDANDHYFNYYNLFIMWRKYSDNFVVRVFERNDLVNESVVDDFSKLVKIEKVPIAKREDNQSLDRKALLLLQEIDLAVRAGKLALAPRSRFILVNVLRQMPIDQRLLPSRESAVAFQSIFDESNASFRAAAAANLKPFSDDFSQYPETEQDPSLSEVEYAELVTHIANHLASKSDSINAQHHRYDAQFDLAKGDIDEAIRVARAGLVL